MSASERFWPLPGPSRPGPSSAGCGAPCGTLNHCSSGPPPEGVEARKGGRDATGRRWKVSPGTLPQDPSAQDKCWAGAHCAEHAQCEGRRAEHAHLHGCLAARLPLRACAPLASRAAKAACSGPKTDRSTLDVHACDRPASDGMCIAPTPVMQRRAGFWTALSLFAVVGCNESDSTTTPAEEETKQGSEHFESFTYAVRMSFNRWLLPALDGAEARGNVVIYTRQGVAWAKNTYCR